MAELNLSVGQVFDETPTIRSVRLSLLGTPFNFKPGQYGLFQIPIADGPMEDRSLSIASSPTRPDSLLFATRRSDSAFKKAFFALKPGAPVTLSGPVGRFVLDATAEESVFLSGGIGITPLISMLEYIADRFPDHPAALLYGNRSPDEIAFRRDLDEIARTRPNITVSHIVSSAEGSSGPWTGPVGRIDEAMIRRHVKELGRPRYYICGPPGMVAGLRELLDRMAVPRDRVLFENFEGYE